MNGAAAMVRCLEAEGCDEHKCLTYFFVLQDIVAPLFVVFVDQLTLVLYNSCCKIFVKKQVKTF